MANESKKAIYVDDLIHILKDEFCFYPAIVRRAIERCPSAHVTSPESYNDFSVDTNLKAEVENEL